MGYLSDQTVENVRQAIDIVSLVGEYVQLKRAGSLYKGLCPFHQEKTPSFVVTEARGTYHCFGCGEGGDGIQFIMKEEGLDFPDAVRFLAKKYGVPIEETKTFDGAHKRVEKLYALNRDAMLFYYRNLLTNRVPQNYLRSRGLTSDIINDFFLGYADGKGSSLYDHLHKKGYADEDMLHLGLISRSNRGTGFYDRFRNRLMFPILSNRNRIIGFGGRIIGTGNPKYLNSPESDLFHKGENLYGVHILQKGKNQDRVLLVEGYMDVIALHASGAFYAAASLGTALTPQQAHLIRRYGKQVYLCYDGDAAGIKASRRAIEVFQKEGVIPKMILLPDGKDPDEFVREKGLAAFEKTMEEGLDPPDFELRICRSGYDMETVAGRVDYLRAATTYLATLTEEATRDIYAAQVAESVGADVESVRADVKRQAALLEEEKRERGTNRGPDIRRHDMGRKSPASDIAGDLYTEQVPDAYYEALYDAGEEPQELSVIPDAVSVQMGMNESDETGEQARLEFEMIRLCQADEACFRQLEPLAEKFLLSQPARALFRAVQSLRTSSIPPQIEWLRSALTDESAQAWLTSLEEVQRRAEADGVRDVQWEKMCPQLIARVERFEKKKRREQIRKKLQEGTEEWSEKTTRAELLQELQALDRALKMRGRRAE